MAINESINDQKIKSNKKIIVGLVILLVVSGLVIGWLMSSGPLLHWSVEMGWTPVARLFVLMGANVNAENQNGRTPLFVAIDWEEHYGNIELIKFLIDEGADVNAKITEKDPMRQGMTPLHLAVCKKNIEVTKYLISQGADIHAQARYGVTPLHYAVRFNENVDVAKLLVSEGADVHTKALGIRTPLDWAALANKNVDVFKFLVSQGADVNATDETGATPLQWAVQCNTAEVVQFLISAGADMNAKNIYGTTMLHCATCNENVEVAKLFISAGADVNARISFDSPSNMAGSTPLHQLAYINRNVEIAELLVSEGADVNAKDKAGKTPLDIARENMNKEVVEYLSGLSAYQR